MIEFSWYGTASVKISSQNTSVVFDPFVTRNSSLPSLKASQLLDVEAIFLTHGHFDHIADVPRFASELDVPVYAPRTVAENLIDTFEMSPDRITVPAFEEEFELGSLSVVPYPSKHISFDLPLVVQTLARVFNPARLMNQFSSLIENFRDHLLMPMGECVGWHVMTADQSLLHFGSMNHDPEVAYPSPDIVSMPFQGHSKIDYIALDYVEKFQPDSVYLHHFDDAFPPVSSTIPTTPFEDLVDDYFPEVSVFVPEYGQSIAI